MSNFNVSNFFLFKYLSEEEKKNLLLNTTRVNYKKGEKIIKSGGFVTHVIYIEKGFVKVHTDVKGREIILSIKRPETITSLTCMINCEKQPFSISALDDSIIHLIDIKFIHELIEQNGKFARQIIDYINTFCLHYITHNLLSFTQNNMHGRLAGTLLYLSEHIFQNSKFDIILSRVELSNFCRISRENVIKILYEFNNEGLIKLNGKQIEIINPEQLRRLTEVG